MREPLEGGDGEGFFELKGLHIHKFVLQVRSLASPSDCRINKKRRNEETKKRRKAEEKKTKDKGDSEINCVHFDVCTDDRQAEDMMFNMSSDLDMLEGCCDKTQVYTVTVKTSDVMRAGTDANVSIVLHGAAAAASPSLRLIKRLSAACRVHVHVLARS